MSKLNKWQGKTELEVSVSDYVLRNLTTGVETFIDTVKSETLSKTSTITKLKCGINNDTIASINGDEEISLEIQDLVSRPELTNAKWGATVQNGAIKKTVFPKNYIVEELKKITLPQTPLVEDEIVIYNGSEPLTKTTDYTIADKVITIVKEDINVGDSLFITSYSYTGTSGEYFEVSESANALAFEIIQRKPIFDTNMNIKSWRVRHFGKATLDPSTEETGESERGEQPITYTFSIEKNASLPYVFRTWYEDEK